MDLSYVSGSQAPEALVVKSVSKFEAEPSSVPAQVQLSADRLPHEQVSPDGLWFSWALREHVQAPAGRWSVLDQRLPCNDYGLML